MCLAMSVLIRIVWTFHTLNMKQVEYHMLYIHVRYSHRSPGYLTEILMEQTWLPHLLVQPSAVLQSSFILMGLVGLFVCFRLFYFW